MAASTRARPTAQNRRRRRTTSRRMTPAQVNILLAIAAAGAVLTGLVSWAVGTEWSRLWTALHAVFGVSLLVLTPAKLRGSVATGMRRGRPSRWISIGFGLMLIATIGVGFAHSTGAWTGVGYWSSLWTHFLLAFASIPFLLWHVGARPVQHRAARNRAVNLDRRLVLGGGLAVAASAATVAAAEVAVRAVGSAGATRRFTGSHEIASFEPAAMPSVSWLDDRAPDIERADWPLLVGGLPVDLDELAAAASPVEAALDCTGGWWSNQAWDAVPVGALLQTDARSFSVRSATGYRVILPRRDIDNVYLAVGYSGEPLRRGHGAPVRLIAPGRRGPWWVKWVTEVEATDRPWWLQSPLPDDVMAQPAAAAQVA